MFFMFSPPLKSDFCNKRCENQTPGGKMLALQGCAIFGDSGSSNLGHHKPCPVQLEVLNWEYLRQNAGHWFAMSSTAMIQYS